MKRERVALIWDMGAGFGHVTKLTALADAAAGQGHEPIVIARNLRSFLAQWGGPRHTLVSAPHNDWFVDDDPPESFADLLWSECGFHDALQLEALALAWRTLLERLRIDRMIVEGAPLALFASAGVGVPRIAMGNGFLAPPPGPDWPCYRAAADGDAARLRGRESAMEAKAIDVLARLGTCTTSLHDALAPDATALVTYAAFDPFGPRSDPGTQHFSPAHGAGEPLPARFHGQPFWFAYLQVNDRRTDVVLQALQSAGADALVVMAGISAAVHGRVQLQGRPLDMRAVLAQARGVICHGGNLAQQAAAAGLPVLVLPLQHEQLHTAHILERRGAGMALLPAQAPDVMAALVDQFVKQRQCATGARAFGQELRASSAAPFDELWPFALATAAASDRTGHSALATATRKAVPLGEGDAKADRSGQGESH